MLLERPLRTHPKATSGRLDDGELVVGEEDVGWRVCELHAREWHRNGALAEQRQHLGALSTEQRRRLRFRARLAHDSVFAVQVGELGW